MSFTHHDKRKLKEALEVVSNALSQPELDELVERDLVYLFTSLKSLISTITETQTGLRKDGTG